MKDMVSRRKTRPFGDDCVRDDGADEGCVDHDGAEEDCVADFCLEAAKRKF
jgi:hypothetical protein